LLATVFQGQASRQIGAHARDEHETILDHRERFEFLADRQAHESQVDPTGPQSFSLLDRRHIAQGQLHGRRPLA
jgi:hypothetical protein